ncbi:MAG: TolC family protein, partial [Burkholderiales bacterium]|nr:TolC family protein [Burkholderiales bacterium]
MTLRICLFTLLLSAGLSAPPAVADTLADALTRAVANMPEVRAARANQRASEQVAAQARGAWYPSVDLSLGRGRETSDNPSTRLLGSDQTLTRREAEVNLSQLIFDGGATSSQVHRFQASAEAAGD